jgi:hypothetical protein
MSRLNIFALIEEEDGRHYLNLKYPLMSAVADTAHFSQGIRDSNGRCNACLDGQTASTSWIFAICIPRYPQGARQRCTRV